MRTKPIAMLCAGLMIASLFLTWFSSPFGQKLIPWDAIQKLDDRALQRLLENSPPELIVFMASFALAGLFLLLSVVGFSSKLLAFAAGACPIGLVGWVAYSIVTRANRSGFPIPQSADLADLLSKVSENIGPGAWAWIGGAAGLALLGLFDPGPKRA